MVEAEPSAGRPRGDGRDCPWCPCREVLHHPAGWDSPCVDATCGFGCAQPSPGSPGCKTCSCCFSEAGFGEKNAGSCLHSILLLILAAAGTLHLSPSPLCPLGCSLCGFSLSRLRSRQVCRNQDSVGLMFQERQELIIFQAQKKPKHLWLRPAIARIQCPCPKPAAVAVPSLGGSSFLPSPSWLGQAVPAGT